MQYNHHTEKQARPPYKNIYLNIFVMLVLMPLAQMNGLSLLDSGCRKWLCSHTPLEHRERDKVELYFPAVLLSPDGVKNF